MSITSENNRTAELVTNGIETEFDFGMLIHADSEIEVWYEVTAGDYTQLTLDTHYTVVFTEYGGTVTTIGGSSPYAAGKILIIRHIALTQQTNWLYNDAHTEQAHQDDFDRSVMRDLQIQEQLDRCISFEIYSSETGYTFPDPASDELLGWNNAADNLENKDATAILDLVKTVDGSGSGLDADLLDGRNAAYFEKALTFSTGLSRAGDTITTDDSAIDHDGLNNTHNLTTDIDHDQLTNFVAGEHFLQSAITEVGTIATGVWEGTDVGIAHGGTGASTVGAARTNLGLVIGTDVQAYDAGLQNLAGVTMAADKFYYTSGDNIHVAASVTAFARTILDDADEATFKATVNLEIDTDVLAQQTIGIADDNLVEIDDAGDAADNEYAKFTANGLEGRTYANVRTDINVADGADVTGDNPPRAHKDLHDPQDGSDALDTAAPLELASVQASGTGTSHSLARADHAHQIQHSIADNHLVTIHGTPNSGESVRFTVDGLEGRTASELRGDFDLASRPLDNLSGTAINTSLISDTDGTDDLGSDAKKWRDLYVDTAFIGSLVGVAGSFQDDSGGPQLGLGYDGATKMYFTVDASGDVTIQFTAGDAILPFTDDAYDLGSATYEWRNIYIDGTAYIDAVGIDSGTIDGTIIGSTTPATGAFTDISVATPGISVDGTDGYIDLTTANNFLNDLRVGKLAIVQVVNVDSSGANYDRIVSAEATINAGFNAWKYDTNKLASKWDGTEGYYPTISAAADDEIHNKVDVIDVSGATIGWLLIDGVLKATDTTVEGLAECQATLIRLGARAYDAVSKAIAKYGFFAVLDLSDGITVDQAFAESLSAAIHGAGYNPEAIRAAIMGVDAAITGVFWKLDEAGISGSFDSQTVIRYDITDGSVDNANGGTSSAAGCDGAVIAGNILADVITANTFVGDTLTASGLVEAGELQVDNININGFTITWEEAEAGSIAITATFEGDDPTLDFGGGIVENMALAANCTQAEWDLAWTHIDESGASHSLLGATPGTASAGLALIVDASKDIDFDGGDITAATYNTLSILPVGSYTYLSGDGIYNSGLTIAIPINVGGDFLYGWSGTEHHKFGNSGQVEISDDGALTAGSLSDGTASLTSGNFTTTGWGRFDDGLAVGTAVTNERLITAIKSYTGSNASVAVIGQMTHTLDGDVGADIWGIQGQTTVYTSGYEITADVVGIEGNVASYSFAGGATAVDTIIGARSAITLYDDQSSSITNLYGIKVEYSGPSGYTIGTEYGLYLPSFADWAIYSAGGTSYHAGDFGIGVADPHSKLEVNGAISSATLTVTTSSDALDVSNVNTVFINISGDIILGGLIGGVDGQIVHFAIIGNFTNHVRFLHAEGIGGSQDFINHTAGDEDIDGGGCSYVCNGTNWYDISHAKHI